MTQEKTDYKTRFTFHLLYHDGYKPEELTCLNFFANLKEFTDENASVENSIEIEETFYEIIKIFQNYLKRITIDSLYKNYDEASYTFLPSVPTDIDNEDENSLIVSPSNHQKEYIFKLIDHEASMRVNGELSEEKEVRVIYQKTISGNDFINPNPLSILPIWKDNEINQVGIRTLLKNLLEKGKYHSRFKNYQKHSFKNSYSINTLNI